MNVRSMETLSRTESNGKEQKVQAAAAADRAQDRTAESQSQSQTEGHEQMEIWLEINLNEEETLTSSQIDEQASSSFQSRCSPSSVSPSSEAELTALDEEILEAELDFFLEQLSQLQLYQNDDDVQYFVNSLPNPGHFDMLGESLDKKEQLVVEKISA